MRLDKLLTELGTGSRSEVKKYIRSGLVTVNGEVVKKPEQKVDEKKDTVCFRGNPLTYTEYEYYLFHKPAGCVTATEDNLHRTVMDYLTDTRAMTSSLWGDLTLIQKDCCSSQMMGH